MHAVEEVGVVVSILLDPLSCVIKDNLAVIDQGLRKQYVLELKKKNWECRAFKPRRGRAVRRIGDGPHFQHSFREHSLSPCYWVGIFLGTTGVAVIQTDEFSAVILYFIN